MAGTQGAQRAAPDPASPSALRRAAGAWRGGAGRCGAPTQQGRRKGRAGAISRRCAEITGLERRRLAGCQRPPRPRVTTAPGTGIAPSPQAPGAWGVCASVSRITLGTRPYVSETVRTLQAWLINAGTSLHNGIRYLRLFVCFLPHYFSGSDLFPRLLMLRNENLSLTLR